jgi:uncharacterized protein YjbJ (UPF0337 family)
MTKTWKELLEDEIEILRQGRDELRVQIHLGAADARDAWDKVEKNWEHLESHIKQIGRVTQESADEVESAAKLLVEEIKAGYEHLRDTL